MTKLGTFDASYWSDKTINGDWQLYQYPYYRIIGDDESRILNLTSKATTSCKIETFEFDFRSLEGIKEVNGLTLLYKGVGNPDIQLRVGSRLNQNQAVTYTQPSSILETIPGETKFYFKDDNVASKFVKFEFTWDNTPTVYVDELYKMSVDVRGIFTDKVEK